MRERVGRGAGALRPPTHQTKGTNMPAKDTAATETPTPALNLQQGGKGWKPKDGDEVQGILRAIDKGWSDWSQDFYPILTIEREDGSLVAVHAFHSVLFSRLMTLRPRVGEYVGVKYHGQEKSNDGKRTVSLYSFDVSRPDADESDAFAGFTEPKGAEATADAEPEKV